MMNVIVSLILWSGFSSAGLWAVSVKNELVNPGDSAKRSIIHFKSADGKTVSYTPEKLPFGCYEHKDVVIHGQHYIVTFWADGSRSVYYRVFAPEKSNRPICEFSTETENPQLRYFKGQIQYQDVAINSSSIKEVKWQTCPSLK